MKASGGEQKGAINRTNLLLLDDDADVLLGRTAINLKRFDSGSELITRQDTMQLQTGVESKGPLK